MSAIVKFYVLQIKMKKMTIDDVPVKWREQAREELENESEEGSFLISTKGESNGIVRNY